MNKKVSELVRKYVEEHLDKSDQKQEFEVFVVWQCYILGNAKWLLSTASRWHVLRGDIQQVQG